MIAFKTFLIPINNPTKKVMFYQFSLVLIKCTVPSPTPLIVWEAFTYKAGWNKTVFRYYFQPSFSPQLRAFEIPISHRPTPRARDISHGPRGCAPFKTSFCTVWNGTQGRLDILKVLFHIKNHLNRGRCNARNVCLRERYQGPPNGLFFFMARWKEKMFCLIYF